MGSEKKEGGPLRKDERGWAPGGSLSSRLSHPLPAFLLHPNSDSTNKLEARLQARAAGCRLLAARCCLGLRHARSACGRQDPVRAPEGRCSRVPPAWKEFFLRQKQALLRTGVSASSFPRLGSRILKTLWRRGSGPRGGATGSVGPGGARPFSAPPLPPAGLSRFFPVSPPFLIYTIRRGVGKIRPQRRTQRVEGSWEPRVFTAQRGVPRRPQPASRQDNARAQASPPQSARAAGPGSVSPAKPAPAPGSRSGTGPLPHLAAPLGSQAGVLSCEGADPPVLVKRRSVGLLPAREPSPPRTLVRISVRSRLACPGPLGPAAPLTPGGEAPRGRPGAPGLQSERMRGAGTGVGGPAQDAGRLAGAGGVHGGQGGRDPRGGGGWGGPGHPLAVRLGGAVGTGDCDRFPPRPPAFQRGAGQALSADGTKARAGVLPRL